MASLEDRSVRRQARWRVRWRAGRGAAWQSFTFTSPPAGRARSEAEKAARRLQACVDHRGHEIRILEALVGAGFEVRARRSRR